MALGYEPQKDTLILSAAADFTTVIKPKNGGVFPPDTEARLTVLDSTGVTVLDTWDATVTPYAATWLIAYPRADAVPAGSTYRIHVSYATVPESTEHLWVYGRVVRKQ